MPAKRNCWRSLGQSQVVVKQLAVINGRRFSPRELRAAFSDGAQFLAARPHATTATFAFQALAQGDGDRRRLGFASQGWRVRWQTNRLSCSRCRGSWLPGQKNCVLSAMTVLANCIDVDTDMRSRGSACHHERNDDLASVRLAGYRVLACLRGLRSCLAEIRLALRDARRGHAR